MKQAGRALIRAWAVLVALVFPNCITIPPWQGAVQFEGCFRGPITDPPGQRDLTIVLEVQDGSALGGCVQGEDPAFQATLAGRVLEELTLARLTGMAQGRPPFTLVVERHPSDASNAASVSVRNETGSPFVVAPNLPRCGVPRTCADLGIPQ